MSGIIAVARRAVALVKPGKAKPVVPDKDSPSADPPNPYQPGADKIRTTATWLAGALAAIATVMLAGSQLSDIGTMSPEDEPVRFGLAIGAAVVAVAAVAFAVYRLTVIQLPALGGLALAAKQARDGKSELVKLAASDPGLRSGRTSVAKLLSDYDKARTDEIDATKAVEQAQLDLGLATKSSEVEALKKKIAASQAEVDAAAARAKKLRPTVVHVVQLATYLDLRAAFAQMRKGVFVAALVAAAAFVTFAWAANPPDPELSADSALDAVPVYAELRLTQDGVDRHASLLGEDCAATAQAEGVPVLALASSSSGVEVVLVPSEDCATAARFVVSSGNGTVVAADPVQLPVPTEPAEPTEPTESTTEPPS